MEVGLLREPFQLNPELEILRAKALQENAFKSDEWIKRMIERTSRLHAGFLFEDPKTLQNICLLVCETQSGITSAGWNAFGYYLGLSPSVLKVINHNNFNKEDPCYNILLAYVQCENASVGKVIEAFHSMGRIDVLSRIEESISNLADIILNCQSRSSDNNNSIEETSDYGSLSVSEGFGPNENIQYSSEELIKPKVIPPAPFIFQNIKGGSEQIQQALSNVLTSHVFSSCEKGTSQNNNQNFNKISCFNSIAREFETKLVRETLQTSGISNGNKENISTSKKQKYGMKILLTFAEDGEKYVNEICKIFRQERKNYPSIGVLVLSEHVERVNKDPQQFISGSFCQVDYVCPILTTGYFTLITKRQGGSIFSSIHIDSAFVTYIYRLMNTYFVDNNCLNDKVRCIIPETELESFSVKFLLKNPLFGAWVKLGEVEELATTLLKSTLKKNVKAA